MLFDWEIGVKVKLATASKWPCSKGLDKGHHSLDPFIVATLSGYLGLLLFVCPLYAFFFFLMWTNFKVFAEFVTILFLSFVFSAKRHVGS